ncbi:MAG: ribonuclease III [Oscillospiraceae bacterium]|nr:ribonuclease III [Oscillospiraceae bacterium]
MYAVLETALGYHYKDQRLLTRALSHSSHANEVYKNNLLSYERLEFLGDSILGFVTAEFLYHKFPMKQEGELTRIRAELVCEKNLSAVAEQIHLGDYLLLGHGEAQGGGRHRSGILCDVMESLIAAAYLDSGFEEAKGIITRLILPKLQDLAKNHDYKTELQELIQQKKDQHLNYEVLNESGPDHCKEFLVRVCLNGKEIGRATGTSKKRAEQAAASHALEALRK